VKILLASLIMWCTKIARSDGFTFICGVVTIISFLITVYISIKTKKIHKKITEYKKTELFNKDRRKYSKTIMGYQKALMQDNADIYKVRINILNDINTIGETYAGIFNFRQKWLLRCLKKELKKSEKIDVNKVCNEMSELIAKLSVEKEYEYE